MKKIHLFVILLFGIGTAKSQELHIGDMLPNITVRKTVPAIKAVVQTADYKDKLLIINFWAINCGACIAAMPRIDSLQQHFGNQIKILPVIAEEEDRVNALWKKNRNTKNLSLFTVVDDNLLLSGYFPHKSVPHEVWVHKGKVVAITSEDEVTAANIETVLAGKQVDLPLKDDFGGRFDGATKPIKDTASIAGTDPSVMLKYVMLSKYKPAIKPGAIMNENRGGISKDVARRSVRAYVINQPIYTTYLWALFNAQRMDWLKTVHAIVDFEPNRIVWEVNDQSKYKYDKALSWDEWNRRNAICYESLNPDTGQTDQQVYHQIAKDLNDLLGLDVHFEKRKLKTLVLTRTGQADLLKTKNEGIDPSYNSYKEGHFFRLRNAGIAAFVKEFNQYQGNAFAIDGSGYTIKVDMDLNIPSWTDLANVKKELNKYGLGFKEEIREVEVLVFSETGGGYRKPTK
ncbi:TlpA family protein disulfide reductase [Pedobacter hiemivivus]|nr:TlpA disulfide reductase family protein [Pedobacter hiemivivus]